MWHEMGDRCVVKGLFHSTGQISEKKTFDKGFSPTKHLVTSLPVAYAQTVVTVDIYHWRWFKRREQYL